MNYENIYNMFDESVWNIIPAKFYEIIAFIELKIGGGDVSEEKIASITAAAKKERLDVGNIDGIAVLPLHNTMFPKANLMTKISGATSTEQFGRKFDQAVAAKNVKGIIIDVDSPGGSVHGLNELSDKIFDARGSKPIVAVANQMAASAALFVATAADDFLVSPSAITGHLGSFMVHGETSQRDHDQGFKFTVIRSGENKAEGHSVEPLTDKARAGLQSIVDGFGQMFIDHVARNRGVSSEMVASDFGRGRGVLAADAVDMGMADGISTLDQAIGKMQSEIASTNSNRKARMRMSAKMQNVKRKNIDRN